MCTSSCQKLSLKRAVNGWMSTTSPFSIRKPSGLFIQPFTEITINEPVMPVRMMGIPHAMCTFGGRRSQPYT